ncbi:hypothetical protein LINGRAHAP2_LOCUS3868 [Linum grandiflorum]
MSSPVPRVDHVSSPVPGASEDNNIEDIINEIEREMENDGGIEKEIRNEEENSIKKGRGKNKCGKLAKLKQGEKLEIKFFNRRGVGENSSTFVRKMGVIYRDPSIVPVQVKKWKALTSVQLDHIWAAVQECFHGLEMEENRANTLHHMKVLWNKWRSRLNVEYVGSRSKENALKNIPPMMKKEDWEWLVEEIYFTEKYQKKSETNRKNRKKEKPCPRHHNGTKATRQIIYDLIEEGGGEFPDLLTIYNRVYAQDGVIKDPGALAKLNDLEKALEDNPDISDFELIEKAFGPQKHGSVVCLGGGVKPKDFKNKSGKIDELAVKLRKSEEEKANLEKELEAIKNAARIEAEQQKQRMDEMGNQMAYMQAQMQAFMNTQKD